jgi:hypothetical protein
MDSFNMSDGEDWMNQDYGLPSASFPTDTLSLPQLQHGTAERSQLHSVPGQYVAQSQPQPLPQYQISATQPLAVRSVPQPSGFAMNGPPLRYSDAGPPHAQTLPWGSEQQGVVRSTHRTVQQSHPNHSRKQTSNPLRHPTKSVFTKPSSSATQGNNRVAQLEAT